MKERTCQTCLCALVQTPVSCGLLYTGDRKNNNVLFIFPLMNLTSNKHFMDSLFGTASSFFSLFVTKVGGSVSSPSNSSRNLFPEHV